MARYGMNPARRQNSTYKPARVTAAVVTYIPSLEGYFSQRLEVLKVCLASLRQTLDSDCDIAVLNNGSCQEVREYLGSLLEASRIDYLLHSRRNLGVIGAFKILFSAVPGEIIAYSDDDVFYYPGWLEEHLRILDTYPGVGMVSGAPVGFSSEHAFQSVDNFIEDKAQNLRVSGKERIPAWERDWALSTGRDAEEHLGKIQETPHLLLEYQDVLAIKAAKHFQFVTPKKVILQALGKEWPTSLMDGLVALDEAVDRRGFLRLSTVDRVTRHIGNTINPELIREISRVGIDVEVTTKTVKEQQHWLLKIPGSGRILWPLYRWLFNILHGVK